MSVDKSISYDYLRVITFTLNGVETVRKFLVEVITIDIPPGRHANS